MTIDLFTLEEDAARCMSREAFEYAASGSGDERTLAANVQAWEQIWLRPRVLRDVSHVSTASTVLGAQVALPVVIAPTAMHRLFCPEGEVATARGAATAGTVMTVSMTSTTAIEDIARGVPDAKLWMHVTMHRDRARSEQICRRAAAAGCTAIVLTVDSAVATRRPRTERVGVAVDPHIVLPNLGTIEGAGTLLDLVAGFDRSVTFDDIATVSAWAGGLPVVVKGVVRGDDAARCVDAGASAVVVSNHGGRELDQAVPTARALPDVVEGVRGRAEVYVDGGIRRGVHVLAALALGADAVLVGRPVVYGLSIAGAEGVAEVLEQLRFELETSMILCGVRTVEEATADLVNNR